jgi:hypothetical protein
MAVVRAAKILLIVLVMVVQAVGAGLVQLQFMVVLHKPINLVLQVMAILVVLQLVRHLVLAVVEALEVLVNLETMELLFQVAADRVFNSRPE